MAKVIEIEFRKCPSIICNYYDKGPSDKRVVRAKIRGLFRKKERIGDEYIITHSYGKDYWKTDKWGDWKLVKTTENMDELCAKTCFHCGEPAMPETHGFDPRCERHRDV